MRLPLAFPPPYQGLPFSPAVSKMAVGSAARAKHNLSPALYDRPSFTRTYEFIKDKRSPTRTNKKTKAAACAVLRHKGLWQEGNG